MRSKVVTSTTHQPIKATVLSFVDCDAVTGTQVANSWEIWIVGIAQSIMLAFACLTLFYIMQRKHFGALGTLWDYAFRKWMYAVLYIVWVEVAVLKTYSGQKVCWEERSLVNLMVTGAMQADRARGTLVSG